MSGRPPNPSHRLPGRPPHGAARIDNSPIGGHAAVRPDSTKFVSVRGAAPGPGWQLVRKFLAPTPHQSWVEADTRRSARRLAAPVSNTSSPPGRPRENDRHVSNRARPPSGPVDAHRAHEQCAVNGHVHSVVGGRVARSPKPPEPSCQRRLQSSPRPNRHNRTPRGSTSPNRSATQRLHAQWEFIDRVR